MRNRAAPLILALSLGLVSAPCALAGNSSAPNVVSGGGSMSAGLFTAGPDGAEIVLPSRAHLRLGAGTALRIFPAPQALQLTRGPKTNTWSFLLLHGRVEAEVPKSPRSAVLGQLGKLCGLVTAGRAVYLSGDNTATVAAADGDVRSLYEQRWQRLEPGEYSRLDRDNPSPTAAHSLPGPELSPGLRMWFSADSQVALDGLHWAAVRGARGYEMRLRDAANDKVMEIVKSDSPDKPPAFKPVGAGVYEVAARSVDEQGLEGLWSQPAPLRVVGVVLPPGGYILNSSLFVGPNQEVRFTHTEGLEMTYVGAGRYFPATQAASLYRNRTTVVGFRLPGTLDTAFARLEPRDVFADVNLGPKTAAWPKDKVQISVELKTKTGRPAPDWIEPTPHVTVGLEPVELKWERVGSKLQATLEPPSAKGPWVVRVDVTDQHGVPLGRDFLEIVESARSATPARGKLPAASGRNPILAPPPAKDEAPKLVKNGQ